MSCKFFFYRYIMLKKTNFVVIGKKSGRIMIGKKAGDEKKIVEKSFDNMYKQKSPMEK